MAILKKKAAVKAKTTVKAKPAAKKVAVKKAAVKKPVAKKVASAKPAAKKAVAKKVAVKKVAAKKPVAKKVAVKKAVAVKKPVVKKTVAAKPVAPKAAVKKTVAKKAVQAEIVDNTPKEMPELLLEATLKVLDERQAEEVVVIPLAGRSSIADYMIIATGRAGRQVAAIADYLREAFFKLGMRQVRIEGQGEANWVLVDAGDIVIHLFRPEVRKYYDLDKIWDSSRPKE